MFTTWQNRDRKRNENDWLSIFINTAAKLKKFIRWIMKLRILSQFILVHEHFYFDSDSDH